MFLGSSGGGNGGSNGKKNTASSMMMKKRASGKELKHMEMEELFEKKMEELTQKSMPKGVDGRGQTDVDAHKANMSKSQAAMLQIMARKEAKKEYKQVVKQREAKDIKAKSFGGMQGGRIDKSGRVFDATGKQILQVDGQGRVKNMMGNVVGKYNPASQYSEYGMQKLIDTYDSRKKAAGHLFGAPAGGAKGGSVWGSGGGSVWGSGSDDKGGGWNGNGW